MDNIFSATDILLPREDVDIGKWSVLACDQFTSEPDYWYKAQGQIGDAPSTMQLILPEIFLGTQGEAQRISDIHQKMSEYMQSILTRVIHGFVYVERETQSGIRCGLVGAIDLEHYSYEKGAPVLIRPTEGTVVERIPPRLAVRQNAALELPHIMMLADDIDCELIEPFSQKKNDLPLLYDSELMLDGGHITGYAVTSKTDIEEIHRIIAKFCDEDYFYNKYPLAKCAPMALAVGDGNHSLATAKAHWQQLKKTLTAQQITTHPARYCLAEVVNIHADSIKIEPIHRVLFGADEGSLLLTSAEHLNDKGGRFCPAPSGHQVFRCITRDGEKSVGVLNAPCPMATASLDAFLDFYIAKHKGVYVDYVHDEQSVIKLAKSGNIGVMMPPFNKGDIFKGVLEGGVLPRKTFSMGSATEKRYYLESRKIIAI